MYGYPQDDSSQERFPSEASSCTAIHENYSQGAHRDQTNFPGAIAHPQMLTKAWSFPSSDTTTGGNMFWRILLS